MPILARIPDLTESFNFQEYLPYFVDYVPDPAGAAGNGREKLFPGGTEDIDILTVVEPFVQDQLQS